MSKARKTMPVLTIAGVLLPAICVGATFILGIDNRGSGGWGLGEIAILVVLIVAGTALGAVSTLLALLRREPWRPLQAIVLPAPERVAPQAIVLAYPAPYSAEAERGDVIGQRDSRGVVTSLRAADSAASLNGESCVCNWMRSMDDGPCFANARSSRTTTCTCRWPALVWWTPDVRAPSPEAPDPERVE